MYDTLKEYRRYSSIDMEIAPYLEMLQAKGIWKSNYWLAYYVAYSDNFITMRSKSADASAKITADLSLDDLKEVKTGIMGKISLSRDSIEYVANKDGEMSFAGAMFISLQDKGLFKRQVTVKYNTSDPNEIILD